MIMSERQQKYYAELHRRARRNRKTITEALKWLDDNYTGDTRKAHRHQMEAEPWQLNVESQLRMIYKNLIKMEKPQPASRS